MESAQLFSILLFIALGAVFVLLGTWLYKNPRRLVLTWSVFNRDNPRIQTLARGYATFLIFFGFMALTAIGLVYLRIPGAPLLAVAASIALTWFIHSRLKKSPSAPVESNAAPLEVVPKQPLLNAHWKRNLAVVVGFFVLLMFALIATIGNSEVSKMAVAAAQTSPTVRQKIGQPINRGFFTSGNIETSGSSGKADLAIPISGPKGKASLYAVAHKSAGIWKLDTLEVSFNDETRRLDLLREASGRAQP